MAGTQAVDAQASSDLHSMKGIGAMSIADATAVNFCRETPPHTGVQVSEGGTWVGIQLSFTASAGRPTCVNKSVAG